MKLFNKSNKTESDKNDLKTNTHRSIYFECIGFMYPYFLLMLFKFGLIFFNFYVEIRSIYLVTFYLIVIMVLMFLNRGYFNKMLKKEITKIYPKVSQTGLKIQVFPSIRFKNIILVWLLNFILMITLLAINQKNHTLVEIVSGLFFFSFISFIISFAEYICCIHVKPNILIEPVEVWEVVYKGKELIDRKNLYDEYKEIIDEINEKALGYIILDDFDEFDLKVIALKNKLNNFNSKFENITIESIFITGLVLSGFFTIFTTKDINTLNNTFSNFLYSIQKIPEKLNMIASNVDLLQNLNFDNNQFYTMISILALICSSFYVLVLIMRLRINHIYVKTNSALSELEFLNNRCKSQNDPNILRLEKKRNHVMDSSQKLVKTLNTTSEFISLYRLFGLITFYLIILLSTFQINYYFGLTILLFTVLSHFIKKIEEIYKLESIRNLINKY